MDNVNRTTRMIPILVDNGLNRAYALKYAIFSLFGLVGAITELPALREISGAAVASIVGMLVCVSAAIAATCAWNVEKGMRWLKTEIYSTYSFIAFVMVYDIALIIGAPEAEGRGAVVLLTTALMVMPIWRIRYLVRRASA